MRNKTRTFALRIKVKRMEGPYIICHMITSIDGRIDCDMVDKISGDEYYTALRALDCPSQLSGKVTAEMHYALPERYRDNGATPVGKESYYKTSEAGGYFIVADTKGTLLYDGNRIDDLPLIVLTSEQASTAYLKLLEARGISYICTGGEHIDLAKAMRILHDVFDVKRLAVCGGGNINGAFLAQGLLDEVSLMIAAGIDGRKGMTAVFDGIHPDSFQPTPLRLESVQRIGSTDTVWIRYKTTESRN